MNPPAVSCCRIILGSRPNASPGQLLSGKSSLQLYHAQQYRGSFLGKFCWTISFSGPAQAVENIEFGNRKYWTPPLCWQTYPWYWSIPKGQEALVLWQDQLAVSSVKALELYNLAVIHSLVQRAIAVKGLSTCFGEPKLTTVWKLQQKMLQ